MSYPKKLLRLKPTRGIASDTPANEVGPEFYTTGQNVIFRKGFASRIGGYRQVYLQSHYLATIQHMLNAQIDGTNFWLFWDEDEVFALETDNSADVTPAATLQSVPAPWYYASTILNGVPVFTNGLDAPQYWAGDVGTPFVALPDWPVGTICKSIVAFQFHLIALDIDGPSGHFESQILWSDAAEPGAVPASWTPAADNEAGDAILGDTPGPVLCAVPLRGSLMIYKRSATYAMDYVGGNDVFSIRTLFTSSGALTRHSVCDVNGQHFVVTDGDVILTDGTNRQSVAQGRMKDYLFGQLDQDNYENLFVIYNRGKNEVWVCYPESGNTYCTHALVYDVSNDAFGVRELDNVTCAAIGVSNDTAQDETWDADSQAWDDDNSFWNASNYSLAVESLLIGHDDMVEIQDTSDAVALDAAVGRYDLHFGEPERVKFVRRVHVRAQPGFGTLYVRVGARMTPTDTITWSTEQTLTEPAAWVNAFAQGRYISVEVRSTDDEVWTISGIDLEAELRGYF